GVGDQALVLGNHFLLDVSERELLRRPLTLGLNQATANRAGHATPPEQTQAKSLLCAGVGDKFRQPNGRLRWHQLSTGMKTTNRGWIDALECENCHRRQTISERILIEKD